jgi:hypothetical protein
MEMAHESDIIIDDGLHTSQANLNVVYLFKESLRGGSWLIIEDIGKTELNLKLWSVVSRLLNDFESTILDLPNTYIFLAQKKFPLKV